jgi:hypothetical protein
VAHEATLSSTIPGMATALLAFRDEREATVATNGHQPPRTPRAVVISRWLARRLPRLAAVRSALCHLGAAGAGTAAVWLQWGTPAGLGATAVSLVALDLLAD